MSTQEVHFTGALGDILAARLDFPEDAPPHAFALFAHCFTCSKDLPAVKHISDALIAQGIAVLRFDFTGLGHSSGEFANTNFSSNVEDLVAAADYLREHHQAPKIIIGHSLGGAAVLAAAERIKELVAVATIAAPYDPVHVTHIFKDSLTEIGDEGVANVEIAGRQFTIKQQFVTDLEAQKSEKRIHGLNKALLIFHSPVDAIVDIDNARQIYGAARHPKSFISLDNADHLLTQKEDARYVATVLASWARRYIG